jgi:hypothetical protein
MSEIPAINLLLARQHIQIFHQLADGFAAAGGMLALRSGGLDPDRPQPLPASEQLFAIGGVDAMLDIAVRLNRQPNRNVELPLAIFAHRAAPARPSGGAGARGVRLCRRVDA